MVLQDRGVWLAVLLLGAKCMKFFEVLWGLFSLFYHEIKILVDKLFLKTTPCLFYFIFR